MKWITLICVINCLQYSAGSPPSAPGGVRVVYREASFIVTWDVPRRTYGTVTNYVVPVTILPEANQTVYRSQIPLLVLDAGSEIGKMFYLTVSAENKDGLSKPSRPFYIRSPCGEALTVTPGSTITLTSPGYPDPVDRGVICQWGLNTTDTYLIQYRFVLIDFKGGSQTGGQSCDDAFLSLSDDQRPTVKICENRSEQDIQRGPVDKFSFSSGIRSRIRKFKVMITAKVKPPGPPTDIKMTSSRTSISMTWSPPIGRYEPLTSYTLRYRLSNYKREIVLSPRTPWFSINTLNFKGQLLVFNIYGNISDTKGQESKEQYFRAPCGEHLRLPGSRELQISSPGHPRPYAPGISCTWVVDNPQQDNLTVTVVHMDIESSLSCSSDYLSISIGGSSRRCGKILRPISLTTVEKSVKISFLSDYKNQGNGFLIEVKTAGEERTSSPQTDLTQWTGVTSAAPLGGTDTKSVSSGTDRLTIKTTANERLTTETNKRPTTDNVQSFIHASTTESRPSVATTIQSTQITGEPLHSLDASEMTTTFSQQSQNHTPLKGSSSNIYSQSLPSQAHVSVLSSTSTTLEPFRKSSASYIPKATVAKSLPLSSSLSSLSTTSTSSSSSISLSKSTISGQLSHTSRTPSNTHTQLSTALSATLNSSIVLSSISSLTSSSLSSTSSSLSSIYSFEQTQPVPTTEAPWSLSYPEIIGSSIEHAVHNVSIHLEFIRRRRYRKKSISNNINILSTLHDKLYTVFKHPSGILQDLALRIIEADPLFVSLVLIYSVPKLLIQMKTDDDFRLIKFINDTAINELSKDTLTFGEWTLNCNKLSQFRTMKAFYVQEITSPCTLVVGVCGKNTSCATDTTTIFGITCVKSNSTGTASVQSTGRTDGLTPVIVGGSASAVVLLLLIVVLIICRGCPRRSLPVTQHRPFNDILLQSRYIGDKNVQFTAFSSRDLKTNRKRKKAISVSLPTKSIKSPYMNGLLVEKLQQLDFIEDKKTLKQRLRIKYRSRRSNSL
nr:uncharacterized protein LOC105322449 [Crassostrea gigas]XP_034317835.1 uncharacterized protein LOC105322449 [Crassostrea gigas]XP_034317844.1 uncharacterized protein LOC105322449 [Crassostrea gigas]XP_034317851.1 uncharacterized protein LOC105322449 [Crassostrea gigas]